MHRVSFRFLWSLFTFAVPWIFFFCWQICSTMFLGMYKKISQNWLKFLLRSCPVLLNQKCMIPLYLFVTLNLLTPRSVISQNQKRVEWTWSLRKRKFLSWFQTLINNYWFPGDLFKTILSAYNCAPRSGLHTILSLHSTAVVGLVMQDCSGRFSHAGLQVSLAIRYCSGGSSYAVLQWWA